MALHYSCRSLASVNTLRNFYVSQTFVHRNKLGLKVVANSQRCRGELALGVKPHSTFNVTSLPRRLRSQSHWVFKPGKCLWEE